MPYVFVHGLGQKSLSWEKVISCIAESATAVCPDLIELTRDENINYTNLYRAFSDYCNELTEPLNLCGLSLGGILALNYAIDYPENVQSLTLIATQYKMPKTLLKFQNFIFKFMPESAFEKMGFGKKNLIALTKSMMDLDFGDKLKDISCAVLILCGKKDGTNKRAARILCDRISNAIMQLIEAAGHEVNTDNPEKLAAVLSEFYQKQGYGEVFKI